MKIRNLKIRKLKIQNLKIQNSKIWNLKIRIWKFRVWIFGIRKLGIWKLGILYLGIWTFGIWKFRIQKFGIWKFRIWKFGIEHWKVKGLFFGLGSGSKTFLGPSYVDNQLWFYKYSPNFLFSIWPHFGPLLHFFCPFGAIFWSFGATLESGSGPKTFLEPTYVVNQLWFWKYSTIFLLLLRPNLGPFLGYFWSWGQVQKYFWDLLT